jgi:two-component system sensor histidine kinase YesM
MGSDMNFLRGLQIRVQMYIIALLTISVIVTLLMYNYNRNAMMIASNNETYTNEVFSQIKQTINSNYEVLKWLSLNIAYNNSVQAFLLDSDHYSKIGRYSDLRNLLLTLSMMNQDILDLVIVDLQGSSFSLRSYDSQLNKSGASIPDYEVAYMTDLQRCNEGEGLGETNCFAIATPIYLSDFLAENYRNHIGYVYIFIKPAFLTGGNEPAFAKEESTYYLLDRQDTVFMSNDRRMIGLAYTLPDVAPNELGMLKLNDRLMHIQTDELPQISGKIVRTISDDIFYYDIREIRKDLWFVLIAGLLLLLIPFMMMLNNMVAPLRKLFHVMKLSQPNDLTAEIKLTGSREAKVIATRYNQLLRNFQRLTKQLLESNERLLRTEIEKKEAEFAFLKGQVNPHFLYNTLDAIRGIAAERAVPEIREMTTSLARIFRYSVKGKDFVELNEEIGIVKSYLKIQTIRFAGRFDLFFDIPEDLEMLEVPKLILQPIVENAIYHGLEPRYDKGSLSIRAETIAVDRICILRIQDNGVGIDEVRLLHICDVLAGRATSPEDRAKVGIGLMNVQNRLKFIYGEAYGLSINSTMNQGTEVVIKLPDNRGRDRDA